METKKPDKLQATRRDTLIKIFCMRLANETKPISTGLWEYHELKDFKIGQLKDEIISRINRVSQYDLYCINKEIMCTFWRAAGGLSWDGIEEMHDIVKAVGAREYELAKQHEPLDTAAIRAKANNAIK